MKELRRKLDARLLDEIFNDLDIWILACEKILTYYRSSYAKIPADELLMFVNSFSKDIGELTQYAFTESEKQIGYKHQALVERAEGLIDFKENLT